MMQLPVSHAGSKVRLLATMWWAVVLMFGCQTLIFDPRRHLVPEAKRITIPESGEGDGVFKTEDLTFAYKMVRTGGQLHLSGQIRFTDRIAENFPLIQYFHLSVILIDAQGKILNMNGLISAAYYRTQYAMIADSPIKFKTAVTIAEKTHSVAFSYTGKAYDNTEPAGGSMDFWEYPIY
jgi:hypothetical protein